MSLDAKTLRSLRIGDTVRIHFTHAAASGRRSEPFDVVIAAINNTGKAYKEEDGRYYESQQIQWRYANMPVELQPDESIRDNIRGLDTCAASWITEIVKRAPYRLQQQSRNHLYAMEQASFLDHKRIEDYRKAKGEDTTPFFGRPKTTAVGYMFDVYNETYGLNIKPGQYNGHLYQFAQAIIARRSNLAVNDRLDSDRFYAAWNQAGKPGYVGPYCRLRWSFVEDGDAESINNDPFRALVNRKAFTNWVVRNASRFVITKVADLKNMIQAAIDEEEYMNKSMEEELEREYGRVSDREMIDILDEAPEEIEDDPRDDYIDYYE